MKPLVSIVIVNWNGGSVFKDCLASLKKIDYKNYELIIVDNGSTDGTEKLATVKNNKNLGFAGANNQGWKKAKGKYILLLNNDTKVKKDFLTKLVSRIEKDSNIAVIQPRIHIMDKPKLLDNSGSFLTLTGFLQHWGFMSEDSREFDRGKYIFSAKGACMLVRREVVKKIGLFDADYVSYMEETDFCWRVWLAGYKVFYYPEAHIFHKVGFTSKRQNQILVNYHSFKNRVATLFKNLSALNVLLIGGLHLFIIVVLAFYYLFTIRPGSFWMIIRAIVWNIINFRKLMAKRKVVQQLRLKSDAEIFKYILRPIDFGKLFAHFIRSEGMLSGKHAA